MLGTEKIVRAMYGDYAGEQKIMNASLHVFLTVAALLVALGALMLGFHAYSSLSSMAGADSGIEAVKAEVKASQAKLAALEAKVGGTQTLVVNQTLGDLAQKIEFLKRQPLTEEQKKALQTLLESAAK